MSITSKIKGIPAAPGIALGKTLWLRTTDLRVEKQNIDSPEDELRRLQIACEKTKRSIQQIQIQMKGRINSTESALFDAHIMILEDPDLFSLVTEKIIKEKVNAEYAWNEAIEHYTHQMETLENEYFRARALDIQDVGHQVLRNLLGIRPESVRMSGPVVLLARDLTPTDAVELDRTKVLGFCTMEGSSTSHTAIFAKALNLPAVVGIGESLQNVKDGTFVIMDGSNGELIPSPSDSSKKIYLARLKKDSGLKAKHLKNAHALAITLDGLHVNVVANVGSLEEANMANEMGAEGIGLLRTEFLFMGRKTAPSEEEQFISYLSILEKMEDRPVIARTLDIGGDKYPSYMDLGKEANPFLGWRAIRVCLDRPDFFKVQLRALLRAGAGHNLNIMFPMIATLGEFRHAKAMVVKAGKELAKEGIPYKRDTKIGIMVEIPSVAIMADQFAREVDFFSIGTNDLTQFVFAVDRTNQKVAHIADACHPAIFRQIKHMIDAAHANNIWVGVCGELASDLDAVPILLGLGLDEFSMTPASIPSAKDILCSWVEAKAKSLALEVLNLESTQAIRCVVHKYKKT
jgi:phosphoenolpyruvate-protein phosphotransferase